MWQLQRTVVRTTSSLEGPAAVVAANSAAVRRSRAARSNGFDQQVIELGARFDGQIQKLLFGRELDEQEQQGSGAASGAEQSILDGRRVEHLSSHFAAFPCTPTGIPRLR